MTDKNRNALYIAKECMAAGMTAAGAAGVLKNVDAEGVWDSGNLEDSFNQKHGISDAQYVREVDAGQRNFIDGMGFGLVQWTFWSRKRDLLAFARARGVSIADFKMQVAFLIYEMRKDFRTVWDLCCSSNDPAKCCHDICLYYENPSDAENESDRRAADVGRWYSFVKSMLSSGMTVEAPKDSQKEPEPAKVDEEGIPIPQTWPPRTIDAHCSGWPEVWLLQALLKCRGYNILKDGIWTEELTRAVRIFQGASGLEADGVVGPNTYVALGLDRAIFQKE